jgi:transcriptional regulator with XRE-family HTH domain
VKDVRVETAAPRAVPSALPPVKDTQLGARLRELRESSGMSLRALAKALGITPSAVSQIELGSKQPSVNRLIAIVNALGVPLSDVFDAAGSAGAGDASPSGHVLTRRAQVPPVLLDDGVLFRRLSPGHVEGIDFFESTYPPLSKASAQHDLLRHEGFEVGTVTLGELTIEFASEVTVLGPGDSITFPCTDPHFIHNASADETAVATWLIVNPGR